ncbi:MerR family transcriptional regulator [Bacillus safensis FO-36b] [Bacillus safensis subsp. safensis]
MEELEKVMQAKEVLGFSLQELQSFMEIGKQLELNKEGYLLSLDPKERLEKLLDIEAQLTVQHQLISKKLETIQSFKKDLEAMKERAAHAIEQLQK